MRTDYVWALWSGVFLLGWVALFTALPRTRRPMLWASMLTAPLGLSEPLFVPEYWHPPSLFGLAQATGFDIESVVFSFGVGGVASVLYDALTGTTARPMSSTERSAPRHRLHRLALVTSVVSFVPLWLLPWNPIYAASAAMLLGAAATVACRPDLARKVLLGSTLFLAYYVLFFVALVWSAPGYVDRAWNLEALSGIRVIGIPVEELLFAGSLGACWAGLYEHVHWLRPARR